MVVKDGGHIRESMGTDTEKIQAVTDVLKKTEKGKIIYPGALRERCGMDMKEIYDVLSELSRTGEINEILEQRCPHCKNATGITYRTIGEVPDETLCPAAGPGYGSLSGTRSWCTGFRITETKHSAYPRRINNALRKRRALFF